MFFISAVVTHLAPIFLISSPVTSYADQIHSIAKTRSSAGFSLDVPLIMLVASILKIFYWIGSRYDTALLFQAVLTVAVQIVLLHVALLNRPPMPRHKPFAHAHESASSRRPLRFWQWRTRRPYWEFLAYYSAFLVALQYVIGTHDGYVGLQGYVALGVEAMLPLPQILENQRSQSCKGFRFSVLVNWLVGDAFKMSYFFLSQSSVPWAFKMCGIFQAVCDLYLGVQYVMFGNGGGVEPSSVLEKEAKA